MVDSGPPFTKSRDTQFHFKWNSDISTSIRSKSGHLYLAEYIKSGYLKKMVQCKERSVEVKVCRTYRCGSAGVGKTD